MGHEKHKEVALLRRVCVQVCIVCVRVCVSMCMMRFKLYVHNALGMHGKVKSWAFGLQMKCCNYMKHLCFCYVKPHSSRFSNQLFETMLFTYWSCVPSVLSLNQQTSLHTIKSRSVLNDSLCVLSLPVCLCVFVCLLANWSTSAFSISPTQEERKKHLANAAPYLSRSLISRELQECRQRGCHCPGMWTCNLFNFTLRFKALMPGRSHVLDKGAICFSFPLW